MEKTQELKPAYSGPYLLFHGRDVSRAAAETFANKLAAHENQSHDAKHEGLVVDAGMCWRVGTHTPSIWN